MAPHSLPSRVACEGANAKFALVADDKAFGHAQPICKNGGVYAEVLSGTASRADFELLGGLLEGLEWIPEPANLWERVAEARFTLARRGFQAAILDLIIAFCALDAGHTLLTRDRDFARIQTVLPFELDVF